MNDLKYGYYDGDDNYYVDNQVSYICQVLDICNRISVFRGHVILRGRI